jgi:hypothetical protein
VRHTSHIHPMPELTKSEGIHPLHSFMACTGTPLTFCVHILYIRLRQLLADEKRSILAGKNICVSASCPPQIRPTSSEERRSHPFDSLHSAFVIWLFVQPLATLITNSIVMNSI